MLDIVENNVKDKYTDTRKMMASNLFILWSSPSISVVVDNNVFVFVFVFFCYKNVHLFFCIQITIVQHVIVQYFLYFNKLQFLFFIPSFLLSLKEMEKYEGNGGWRKTCDFFNHSFLMLMMSAMGYSNNYDNIDDDCHSHSNDDYYFWEKR